MWAYVKANQHTLDVRKITNDFPHGLWQFTNQRRDRQDLVSARQLRVFEQIDERAEAAEVAAALASLPRSKPGNPKVK